jgi:hypothetical protein
MALLIDATLPPRFAKQMKMRRAVGSTESKNTGADMGAARMLALAIVCVLSLPGIANAQQVKLKAALQVPVTELFFGQNLAQFKKEVEERTRKAVTIEIFDGGKPYNDTQIVDAVTSLSYMDATADLGSRLMAAYGRLRTAPCCSAGPQSATPNRR